MKTRFLKLSHGQFQMRKTVIISGLSSKSLGSHKHQRTLGTGQLIKEVVRQISKGTIPILRQQRGWVGSEKGQFLSTFSTIYADVKG